MAGKSRVTEVINESNFTQFAEAHRLGRAGDVAGVDAIRAELGLRTSNFIDNNGDGVCDGDCNNLN